MVTKKRVYRCVQCGVVVPDGDNFCSDECYRLRWKMLPPVSQEAQQAVCRICGKVVEDGVSWCCSRECHEQYLKAIYTRHCFWCGGAFMSRRKAKFCSAACKMAAFRAGKAEEDDPLGDGFSGRGALTRRFLILERDGFKCRYCGRGAAEGVVLHVDHVVPRAKGGLSLAENLVTACYECNEGKNDMLIKAAP